MTNEIIEKRFKEKDETRWRKLSGFLFDLTENQHWKFLATNCTNSRELISEINLPAKINRPDLRKLVQFVAIICRSCSNAGQTQRFCAERHHGQVRRSVFGQNAITDRPDAAFLSRTPSRTGQTQRFWAERHHGQARRSVFGQNAITDSLSEARIERTPSRTAYPRLGWTERRHGQLVYKY